MLTPEDYAWNTPSTNKGDWSERYTLVCAAYKDGAMAQRKADIEIVGKLPNSSTPDMIVKTLNDK